MDPENGNNPFPQNATGLPRGIILKPDQTGLGSYPGNEVVQSFVERVATIASTENANI